MLLDEFPFLKDNYDKIKGGVFDLDTPSYSFYAEIFVPYMEEVYRKDDALELNHCLTFIENMMKNEDEKVSDIAIKAILIPLYENKKVNMDELSLGKLSKSYYEKWLKIKT